MGARGRNSEIEFHGRRGFPSRADSRCEGLQVAIRARDLTASPPRSPPPPSRRVHPRLRPTSRCERTRTPIFCSGGTRVASSSSRSSHVFGSSAARRRAGEVAEEGAEREDGVERDSSLGPGRSSRAAGGPPAGPLGDGGSAEDLSTSKWTGPGGLLPPRKYAGGVRSGAAAAAGPRGVSHGVGVVPRVETFRAPRGSPPSQARGRGPARPGLGVADPLRSLSH